MLNLPKHTHTEVGYMLLRAKEVDGNTEIYIESKSPNLYRVTIKEDGVVLSFTKSILKEEALDYFTENYQCMSCYEGVPLRLVKGLWLNEYRRRYNG